MARLAIIMLLLAGLLGCQLGYYGQAIRGHSALMKQRQPVVAVLADPQTPAPLASRLQLSREVLAFAGGHLGLPADGVYQSYVALPDSAVVWNVLAAPAYSLRPKTWCFPVAGCVSYRGYFNRDAARRQADKLAEQGWDTYISGAVAYSTLGWFADPLTTPMINRPVADLVDLLIHELVHRRLYVKNDTRFNESLATMVAREGARQFYSHSEHSIDPAYWQRQERAREHFLALVVDTREALQQLYDSDQDEAVMAVEKQRLQQQLRQRFADQQARLPALAAYQGFFDGPLNNAQLNGVSDYHQWVPAFQQRLLYCGGHWPCFWEQVEILAAMAPLQRQAAMEQQWN